MKRVITADGNVALPREIRAKLGVRQGDHLDFVIGKDGTVQIQKAEAADLLAGLAGRFSRYAKSSPVSLAEMDSAIRDAAAERSNL